jgi:hypothetical protein
MSVSGFCCERLPETTPSEMAASLERLFVKTHELSGVDPWPAIYLVRDGRDTRVSYAHHILHEEHGASSAYERELFLRTLQDLIIGKERFGGWASNVRAWTQRTASTSLVHFENLIADPEKELRQALVVVGDSRPFAPTLLYRCSRACTMWRHGFPKRQSGDMASGNAS